MGGVNKELGIKEILKIREKNYLDCTQKILEKFIPQLIESVQEVVFDNEEIDFLVKNIYPITENLNYVSIVSSVATFSVGDIVPLQLEEGGSKPVEVTEENYWNLADSIVINIPITVLESESAATIKEFLREIYVEGNVMDDYDMESPESPPNSQKSSKFDFSTLDEVQKKLLSINYSGNDRKH